MDDGRSPGVEKMEAFQDLSAPASEHFGLHYLETFQIAVVMKKKICYLYVFNQSYMYVLRKSYCSG